MIFSDRDIQTALRDQHLAIVPYDPTLLQPCSYDVTLGRHFLILPVGSIIDPRYPPEAREYTEVHGQYALPPGGFVLASTRETVTLGDNVAAQLEGKSSLGRLGLTVHSTAGFIDPGFHGQITLELTNQSQNTILLTPDMPIGQLVFTPLQTRTIRDYQQTGRYQNQTGPTISKGTRK